MADNTLLCLWWTEILRVWLCCGVWTWVSFEDRPDVAFNKLHDGVLRNRSCIPEVSDSLKLKLPDKTLQLCLPPSPPSPSLWKRSVKLGACAPCWAPYEAAATLPHSAGRCFFPPQTSGEGTNWCKVSAIRTSPVRHRTYQIFASRKGF